MATKEPSPRASQPRGRGRQAEQPRVHVGLLGKGTVGGAFEKLLTERSKAVTKATGSEPRITGVLRRRSGRFDEILAASDVIVELMGGIDPALDYVTRALRSGRHVITANKQLIAQHGDELLEAATEGGAQLRFEAAVAGAIPVIRIVQESLGTIEIEKVFGIVNGTTNFVLTEMAKTGASYKEALADAKNRGYAEADPTDDVTGADAAAKMAILARLAFKTPVDLAEVEFEGIEQIRPDDLEYAAELGLSLKLLGVAERRGAGMSVRVFPCFLYPGHPLAPVEGPFNAVMVEAPAITEITMSGPGAGGIETASAVLGDLVSVMAGGAPLPRVGKKLPMAKDLDSAFYLHLEVADEPGVLAKIAEILGEAGISVRSVNQRGLGDDARLVMVTHSSPEKNFKSAQAKIAKLGFMRNPPRSIRVIEKEFIT